jgi:hypothetical protein
MADRKHSGTEAPSGPKPEDFAGAYHLILKHPDYRVLAPRFNAVLADFFANGGGDEAQLRARLTPEALKHLKPEPPMPLAAMFEDEGFARNYAILMREDPGDPVLRQALTDELVRMARTGLTAAKARAKGAKKTSDRAEAEREQVHLLLNDPAIERLATKSDKARQIAKRLNVPDHGFEAAVQRIRKAID